MTSSGPTGSNDYDPVGFARMDENELEFDDLELGALEVADAPRTMRHNLSEGVSVLQVTIRRPFSVLSVMAIFWSLVPYIISILASLGFLHSLVISIMNLQFPITGHCGFYLFFALLALSGVLLNEKYLKKKYKEHRPAASASHGYGMPSGHCTNSYAWLIWWLLEILVHPSRSSAMNLVSGLTAVLLLAPVPAARVYLQDHTFRQAFVGCVVGTFLGIFAVFVRWLVFTHAIPLWIPVY